jgi:anti-sigma factor RsiW
MTTCDVWREKIGAFVDAELPSDEAAELNAHLRSCHACAAEVIQQFQLKRATHAAGSKYKYDAPAELREKILRKNALAEKTLREEVSQSPATDRRRSRRWSWAPALAAAALILITLFLYPRLRTEPQAPFRELADIHAATLASASPLDVISSDTHTVKPWFQGKIPFSFNPPQLENTPYSLSGGRVTYFHESAGAQLLCLYKQHRISVFIFEDRPEWKLSNAASVLQPTGLSLESWSQNGLRYVVLGDAAPEVIHNLAELWRQAAPA